MSVSRAGSARDLPSSVLRAAAERLVRHPFQAWFYGDSIGFVGLLAASELLGDTRYRDIAYGFLLGWAARDEPRRPDDNTAPGAMICELAVEMDDDGCELPRSGWAGTWLDAGAWTGCQ